MSDWEIWLAWFKVSMKVSAATVALTVLAAGAYYWHLARKGKMK